ncbi:MAG TPA: hypothetical protein VFZ68_05830 [Acidimicrobiales bacterium]
MATDDGPASARDRLDSPTGPARGRDAGASLGVDPAAEATAVAPGRDGTIDRVLTHVRQALALDMAPPPAALAAAAAAGAWLAIEADLATPAYDATGDEGRGFSGLRSAGTVLRQLSFDAAGESLEIEMAVTGDHVRVLGQVDPGRRADVRALWPGGSEETQADDAGVFRFDDLPPAPISFHVVGDPGFKTSWIVP